MVMVMIMVKLHCLVRALYLISFIGKPSQWKNALYAFSSILIHTVYMFLHMYNVYKYLLERFQKQDEVIPAELIMWPYPDKPLSWHNQVRKTAESTESWRVQRTAIVNAEAQSGSSHAPCSFRVCLTTLFPRQNNLRKMICYRPFPPAEPYMIG